MVSSSSVVHSILNPIFVPALVFYLPRHVSCLLARCDPADQGGVCSSVLQPTKLRLPVALRLSLEESSSLLHDRGRG